MTDWAAPAGALWERAWAGRDTQICGWTKGALVCSEPWRQQNPAEHGAVLAEPQAAASGVCRDPLHSCTQRNMSSLGILV